jgi:stage V sporulation protein AC
METPSSYKERIKRLSPSSSSFKNIFFSFLIGGSICLFGEIIASLFISLGMEKENSYLLATVTVIFISALLTGLGIFDKIAKIAGAGTLVPVSGFANAVVSPALDTRAEGYILGVGAKIFTVAGPVILYAVISGTIYGLIYFFISLRS